MAGQFSLKKQKKLQKSLYLVLITAFIFNLTFLPLPSQAQTEAILPSPKDIKSFSPEYNPVSITAVKVNSDDPLLFDFIIDRGDSDLTGQALEDETQRLIKYFLAAMTTPDSELWVNLSPYERDLMIPYSLGITELGKRMLEQDYLLKQITASLTNPESEVGKRFWDRVYKKAYELYGTTEIPINTFSKVWIVPKRSVVLEKEGTAFVAENYLTVMLEEDYLAVEKNLNNEDIGTNLLPKERVEYINNISSEFVKEIVLPELEKEVNEGKNFAPVRQAFNSVILATWYKQRLKDSLLGQVYVDQNKVAGVDIDDKTIKDKIFDQYMVALKDGVYNLIKDDIDLATKETMQRKYFSGGIVFSSPVTTTSRPDVLSSQVREKVFAKVEDLTTMKSSPVVSSEEPNLRGRQYLSVAARFNATRPLASPVQQRAIAALPYLSSPVVNNAINSASISEEEKGILRAEYQTALQSSPAGQPIDIRLLPKLAQNINLSGDRGIIAANFSQAFPDVNITTPQQAMTTAAKMSSPVLRQSLEGKVAAASMPTIEREFTAVQTAVASRPEVLSSPVELASLMEREAPTLAREIQSSPVVRQSIMANLPALPDLGTNRSEIQLNNILALRQNNNALRQAVEKAMPNSSPAQRTEVVTALKSIPETARSMDEIRARLPSSAQQVLSSPVFRSETDKLAGIDLNAQMFDFKIKGDGSIKIPVALKEDMKVNFGGLEPVIIEIKPATPDMVPFKTEDFKQQTKALVEEESLTLSRK